MSKDEQLNDIDQVEELEEEYNENESMNQTPNNKKKKNYTK